MSFSWDPRKAAANLRKHGVDFADAVSAFEDPQALTVRDDHPTEDRWLTMGLDILGRLVVVSYTYRGDVIRLISARKATARETRSYQQ